MKRGSCLGACVALAASALLTGCQLEQVQIGRVFIVYTPPSGACPQLQWQFSVDASRAIDGTLLSNGHPLGQLSGVLNGDDTYRMGVTPTTGGGATEVTGAFVQQGVSFSIAGDAAGPACNGQTLYVHGYGMFQDNPGGAFDD